MAAAVEEKNHRPRLVSVIQTFGEGAKFHPHVHALCSRGGWTASGEWVPLPYVDEAAAEELFRHKVLALLRRRGLLCQERIERPHSWRRSGFSVHNRVFVHPRDGREFEALVRSRMRPPVSLARLHFTPGAHGVVCVPKTGHDESVQAEAERIDAMESWPGPSCRSPTPSAISTAEVYREHPDVLLDLTFDVWGQKHLIDAGLLAAGDLDWLSNVDARPGRARSTRTPAAATTRTYQAQQRGLPEEDGRE